MDTLRRSLEEFVSLVESGQSVRAMEQFYAEDVLMFENRELARAGRDACIAYERAQLSGQPEPPRAKAIKVAANPHAGVCFVEWVIRFHSSSGRPMRLEEVAVQKWSDGTIIEERFYYDGFVDEGDESEE